jgi:hypothetical protein
VTDDDRLYVKATTAAAMVDVDPTKIYELAAAGHLERRFIGTRNYRISVASLRAYFNSLPTEPVDP